MTPGTKVQKLHVQINAGPARMGDLQKIAKDIKTGHALANELPSASM